MKTYKIIVGIILFVSFISCEERINSIEILEKENELKLMIYSKLDNSFDTLTTKRILGNSEKIADLKEWLTRNSDGWTNSISSWATPNISLIGNDFRLLIFDNFIVIGFTDEKGKARQYVKSAGVKEFNFLLEEK